MSQTILYIRCENCRGTGLYVGMAERDGAAIVCHGCKGTGGVLRTFTLFAKRELRDDVTRVYQRGCGFVIGVNPGVCGLSDFGGVPFAEWNPEQPFPKGAEDREHTCPYWFHGQEWKHKRCDDSHAGQRYSDCPHFKYKTNCWALYDARASA